MKFETYDPEKHKHFSIKVTDFNDDCVQYDVFGNDSLQSEAGVYQSCITFPINDVLMIRHADGIALVNSYQRVEIFVKSEPSEKIQVVINGETIRFKHGTKLDYNELAMLVNYQGKSPTIAVTGSERRTVTNGQFLKLKDGMIIDIVNTGNA